MSVLTPKRVVLFVVAALLGSGVYASYPSPRSLARMAYDTQNNVGVMFGGRGPLDPATGVTHNSDETWIWNGATWLQQFPVNHPSARGAHTMVYDSNHGRVYLFGGRQEAADASGEPTYLNDTWFWKDGEWTRVETAHAPSPRHYSGLAYDRERDRIVLFGGNGYAADGTTLVAEFDTWEFDGTDWTRVATDSPKLAKPLLVYDAQAKQTIMMGVNETGLTNLMYRYDPAAHSWTQLTPEKLPTCINEGHLFYQEHSGKLLFMGGVCPTNTPNLEELFEWNGTTWTKVETQNSAARALGQAVIYEQLRQRIVSYGGSAVFDTFLNSSTFLLQRGRWSSGYFTARPQPRSLFTFNTDPISNNVFLFGGLDETSSIYYGDLWAYRDGQFRTTGVADDNGPGGGCETPLGAWDSDRGRLVVTCSGTQVFEFDGTAWKKFSDLKKAPPSRHWARMVYDQKLKKTVLFGGYSTGNYRNDTWTWNGTEWTELNISGDKPPHRGSMAMWYDPLQQKTIIYGGFGRPHINEKITRYADMWALDGNRWSKLNPAQTPGPRFGPQVAVNPETGRVLLFGGLRSESLDDDSIHQFFDNDTWQWDGAAGTWTQLHPQRQPPVRQNAGLTWDPVTHEMVLFGGYANGFYLSDLWTWNGENWTPLVETTARRRSAGRGVEPAN